MIQYATAQVGAILVNINPAYRVDELEYALNKASMCTVFAAAEFKSSDYVAMLGNVRGRCPALNDVIAGRLQDDTEMLVRLEVGSRDFH